MSQALSSVLVTATIAVNSKKCKEETKPEQKQLTFMEMI